MPYRMALFPVTQVNLKIIHSNAMFHTVMKHADDKVSADKQRRAVPLRQLSRLFEQIKRRRDEINGECIRDNTCILETV